MARVAGDIRIVDNDGNYERIDLLKGYQAANLDEGTTSYYGFVDSDGNWYIQKVTATTIEFTRGTTNYANNWTGRAGLSYGPFNSIF